MSILERIGYFLLALWLVAGINEYLNYLVHKDD